MLTYFLFILISYFEIMNNESLKFSLFASRISYARDPTVSVAACKIEGFSDCVVVM